MSEKKHWTTLQAEEAERVPIARRLYCWKHHRTMEWRGCWVCLLCLNRIPALFDREVRARHD